jgi:hypothetical protein
MPKVPVVPALQQENDMVYFIEAEGVNLVKIGCTDRDVESRLRELQTASPHPLVLAGSTEGSHELEKHFHDAFAHLRTVGEWFRIDDELRFVMRSAKWMFRPIDILEAALKRTYESLVMRLNLLLLSHAALEVKLQSLLAGSRLEPLLRDAGEAPKDLPPLPEAFSIHGDQE